MSHLSLAFLGAPEVRHAGRLLTFRTRKTLGLLIYLAVAGGMHSREKLTALFWPESDEEQGRASLRNTLVFLRHALDESTTPVDLPHLLVERDFLGFAVRSDFDLDLHVLQAAYKQSKVSARGEDLHGGARRMLLDQLQMALERHRGNFLDGFSLSDASDFDDWVRLQRETWHRRISSIFDRLSHVQFEGGEIAHATETATRWLDSDPLNEAVYQRLMQAHFALGDRNAALHAYATCRTVLAQELHTQPTPETQALAERIRTRPLTRRVPPSVVSAPDMSSTPSPLSVLPEGPLVGRANEYSTLIESYRAAKLGQAQVVILKGDAGIGKTRLASEFLGWAAAHEADILQGRAFETGGHLPYQALVDALRSRVERENAPDDLLSDIWLAELSRMLPELRERYPDLPPPTADETTARIRLFEAVARLGHALSEREPVVLFIDDVQWADAASLDALHYLGRRWKESKTSILLLLCLRLGTFISAPVLTRWLTSLEHDLRATSVELEALTFEDTMQLVQALAQEGSRGEADTHKGHSSTVALEGFGRWLFNETRGQPFYEMEVLKTLLERGTLEASLQVDGKWKIDFKAAAWDEARWSDTLPPSVREVIRSRVAQLSPAAFALLAAGGVLGRDFTFEEVCQVAGLGDNDGLVALDELLMSRQLAEGMVHERKAYFFTHDKIRDVVYTEAGDARRRVFHRRALEVLQASAAPPAKLAHHARASGLVELTFHYSVAAGDDAMRLFAVRDAIVQYEQARQVIRVRRVGGTRDIPTGSSLPASIPMSALQHLYVQLGRARELVNEFEEARSLYQIMLRVAQESSTSTMEYAALNHLATLAVHENYDVERARSLLNEARQVAEHSRASGESGETVELAETEWNLAQLGFYRFDVMAALAHGKRALELARKLDQQELVARSLNVFAYANLLEGGWEEAETYAGEACALYRALGNRVMEADCLCQIAYARINSGQSRAGISAAQDAYTISTEIENAWGLATSAMHLAVGLLESGEYAQALAFALLAQTQGISVFPGITLMIVGKVHRARFSLKAACTAHQQAIAACEPRRLPHIIESYAAELCVDYALAGEWGEAYTYAVQALTNRGNDLYLFKGHTHWYETEALVRAGDIERAEESVRYFGERVESSRRHRIPYLRSLAVLARHRVQFNQAIEHLQVAAQLAEEINLPGELWSIQAALGEVYQQQGEENQSHRAFARAAEMVQLLADKMEDEQQRSTFLAVQQVQQVLEHASSGR